MKNNKQSMPSLMMEAIYRSATVPEYRGNPLIEALPPYTEPNEIAGKFGRYPAITDSERLLPRPDRALLISRLNGYLEPLPSHYEVIEKMNIIVRAGYEFRNPRDEDFRKARIRFYRESMKGNICPIGNTGPSTAPSFALFGTSGVGKSSVVDRSLSFLPQVLFHQEYKFTQVVWLKLDCPTVGSLKQLLKNMLKKMDELLGSTYHNEVGRRGTIDELILSVAKIAAEHNLGVLVIDEIQNLLDGSGVSQAQMLNFFVTFANEVKIPVVTIGTPRALSMLQGTFREARRVGDHGTYVWDTLNDYEWKHFIKYLWTYQWTAKFTPLTEDLSSVLHDQTQGIHALVVRLFQLAQIQALRDTSECITEALIISVANDKFKLLRPMLDAMKSKNKIAIAKYQDLLDEGIKEIAKNMEVDIKLEQLSASAQKRNQESCERIRTVSVLLAMKYREDEIQAVVNALFNAHPNLTCEKAVKTILLSIQNKTEDKALDISLMDIVKGPSAGKSATNLLSEAGLVSSEVEVI